MQLKGVKRSVNNPLITRLKKLNIPGIVYGAIAIFLFFCVTEEKFLSTYNVILIARNSCILLIASIGMTLVILISQVDLSIGSVMSVAAVVVGVTLRGGCPLPVALLLGFGSGALFGAVNGLMIAVFKIDYWITTFATMSIGAGLALVIADGSTVPMGDPLLDWFGNGKIGGLYVIIILTILVVTLMILVLRRTKLGYNIYSIGGAENVAKVSGINVTKNRFIVYIISGLFSALAGILIAGMTNSSSPIVGTEYSFNAMAAVIIGGTSFDGGKGGLLGTVFGTILLRILASGLSMMGIPATWQKAITGVVIVVILVADVLGEKNHKKSGLRRVYANE